MLGYGGIPFGFNTWQKYFNLDLNRPLFYAQYTSIVFLPSGRFRLYSLAEMIGIRTSLKHLCTSFI